MQRRAGGAQPARRRPLRIVGPRVQGVAVRFDAKDRRLGLSPPLQPAAPAPARPARAGLLLTPISRVIPSTQMGFNCMWEVQITPVGELAVDGLRRTRQGLIVGRTTCVTQHMARISAVLQPQQKFVSG